MITNRVCFILGAGASMDFGFPSGIELLKKIIYMLPNGKLAGFGGSPNQKYFWAKYDEKASTFAKELKTSGTSSIDAFLESRLDYVDIGKEAIAACLIPYESPSNIFNLELKGSNWYDYLFHQMSAPLKDFRENCISFITYNYDRSLEFFLESALRAKYQADAEQIAEIFESFRIVHLHGNLGNLPYQGGAYARAFTTDSNPEIICNAGHSVKIIHEDIAEEPQFKEAHDLIYNANEIAFLGFGFHETNLARLNLSSLIHKQFFATTIGLEDLEIESLRTSFGNRLATENQKILEFLRKSGLIAKQRKHVFAV